MLGSQNKMKKTTLHIALALLFGSLSLYIYFALIGVVTVWGDEKILYSWIFELPKPIQQTAYLLSTDLEGFIIAIPVLGSFGLILGFIVKKYPLLFGFIEYIGALSFYFMYHVFILDGNFMWIDSVPVWSQILPFFLWLFIFLCASLIGNKKLKPIISVQLKN